MGSSSRRTAVTAATCDASLLPHRRPGPGFRPRRSRQDDPLPVPGAEALRHRRAGAQWRVPGYQINPDALRWLAGSGEVRPVDRTRLLDAGEIPPEVNRYFVECYRRFVDLKCVLEAREHTAQVASDDRRGTRRPVPRRRPAAAFLLADDGAGRRYRPAQSRQPAQRPADAGQLRPAQRPRRARRPAGAGLHLLRRPQSARSVLFSRSDPDGGRRRRSAAHRHPQPRPRALAHPRHVDGGRQARPRQDAHHRAGYPA